METYDIYFQDKFMFSISGDSIRHYDTGVMYIMTNNSVKAIIQKDYLIVMQVSTNKEAP